MIEFESTPESTAPSGAMLAWAIMQAVPVARGKRLDAETLALLVLLADRGEVELRHVSDLLGAPFTTCHELVDRALADGHIQKRKRPSREGSLWRVSLSPQGVRLLSRSRHARKRRTVDERQRREGGTP